MSGPRSSVAPTLARREAAPSLNPSSRQSDNHIRSSRSSSEVASLTPARSRSKYSAPPSSSQPKTPLRPAETTPSSSAVPPRTSRVSEQGRTPRPRPSSARPSIPASGSTPSTARTSLGLAPDRLPKSRSHTSSLGSALSQRGILTSTTAANYTKGTTTTLPASSSSSSSLVSAKSTSTSTTPKPSLPKVRPHSLRETPTKSSVIQSSQQPRSRPNSTASDLTVKDKMFGSAPRNIELQRRMRQDSVATVYTQDSAEEEEEEEEGEDRLLYGNQRPSSDTPSLSTTISSTTTESDRNSVGSTRKPRPVEYTNPFGGAMPSQAAPALPHKMQSFGPEGIRKESIANWAADRLGSIGGDVEFKGLSIRFQEIEDLLASGRANRIHRPSDAFAAGLSKTPTKPRSGSIAQAQKPMAAVRRPSIAVNALPPPPMAPPPRPPRARGRARALSRPPELASVGEAEAGDCHSPKKRETQSVNLSEAANFAHQHPFAASDGLHPDSLRPLSVDTGVRRLSESTEENSSGNGKAEPGMLMTREQWEAEYLPRLIEKERKRLMEEHASDSSKASSLKSQKSTPSLSRSPDRSPLKEPTADSANGFTQGKEARRRSQSPLKSHRSSPALSKPGLNSDASPPSLAPKKMESPTSPSKDINDVPTSPKKREGSPFKAALAAAQASRASRLRSDSIRISPFDTVPVPQRSTDNNIAMAPPSRSRSTSPNKLTKGSPKLAPAADILSQDKVNVVDTTSERYPTLVQRGSISSEAGQVGSNGTTQSTPTLDLKMNDPLTNLAIADVSTDLMGDYEHSLMALYKSSDVSFDQGGQNLYKLLGGDGPSGARVSPSKNRPRSEVVRDAGKKAESGHARQHSDHVGSHPRKQDASITSSDVTVTPSSAGAGLVQRTDESSPSRINLGGSPARARVPNGTQQLSSTPIGLGISMAESASPFTSRTPIGGSPLKARLDSGASPDQAALPPLALSSSTKSAGRLVVPGKRSSPTKASPLAHSVGDETTMLMGASTIRNMSGGFLMDDLVDDSMLYGPDIGTFSGKKVEQIKNRLKAARATAGVVPVAAVASGSSSKGAKALRDMYTPPSSGSDRAEKDARFPSQKAETSGSMKAISNKHDSDATEATSKAKDYGFGMRQPSSKDAGGVVAPRPSLGSRIPSRTVQPPARTSSIQRTTSFDNSEPDPRQENNKGRPSLSRSVSADQRPRHRSHEPSDAEPVPPLNIRKTLGAGTPTNDGTYRSFRSSAGLDVIKPSPAVPPLTEAQLRASARARMEAGIKSRASMAALSADHRRHASNASSEGGLYGDDGLPKSTSLGDLSGLSGYSSPPQRTPAASRYGALTSDPMEMRSGGGAGRPVNISRPSLPSNVSRLPTRGRSSGSIPRAPGVPF